MLYFYGLCSIIVKALLVFLIEILFKESEVHFEPVWSLHSRLESRQ